MDHQGIPHLAPARRQNVIPGRKKQFFTIPQARLQRRLPAGVSPLNPSLDSKIALIYTHPTIAPDGFCPMCASAWALYRSLRRRVVEL